MTRRWTVDDLGAVFEPEDDRDRNGLRSLLAFLGELSDNGVDLDRVERDMDSEGEDNFAVTLSPAGGGGRLYVQFPGVPLEWLRRRADHDAEWRTWADQGFFDEIYVQGEQYLDWNAAVRAAVDPVPFP